MTARTPRIVQIVPVIADEASGPSYSVARLCESLIQQGQDVTLAALDWTAAPVPRSYLRTFPLGFGPRRLGRSPRMREWLLREAQEGSFDIMHNHSLWMMPNVYPGQVAKQVNIPYVVSPRGTLSAWAMANGSRVKRLFWPTVQRPSLAATTCFHITAKSECADIRRFGFRQPVCVIPNGVDIRPLLAKADHNHRTLLFLGRIHPIKGVDILLRAWGAVMQRYPDWCLRIVGPDNDGYLPRMKRLATGLAVERVTFSGPLYGDAKWRNSN